MSNVKSKQDIINYRKFLYQDEYPDGNYPNDLIYPSALNEKDILEQCAEAKKLGFSYFLYCPNCHDSWFGASGLNKGCLLNICNTCNFDNVIVYDVLANERCNIK